MSKAEFKVLELLGKGSYGSVYRVVRLQDGLQYALKVVPFHTLTPKQKKNALNEVRVLASIKHPNIIQYHQAFFDQADEELCLVMELVDGGDLKNIIKGKRMGREQFYQYQIWNMGHEILKGIHQLHTNSIIHRDIKPSNILCNKSNPKISDFNISTQLREDLAHTQIGTPYYSAPEIWDNQSYAYECDVWSFGCLLYQMCCLDVPFQHKNIKLLYQAVRKCQFEEIPARFSLLMRKVMRMCICKRERRASVGQLLKLFEKYVAPKPQSSLFTEKVPLLDPISIPTTVSDIKNSLPNPKYSQPQTPMNILDRFMKKVSDKPQYLSLVSSEKSLKPRKQSSQKTVKKTPSFMKAVKERSHHYGIPMHERFSLERLSMGRRKLPLMMRLDY